LPLAIDAPERIRENLLAISRGEKVKIITIGTFTIPQFVEINTVRASLDLHPLEFNEIIFMGRHLHKSRCADGYSVEDMLTQIESALCSDAEVSMNKFMSCLQNPAGREDGYGNIVYDRAVFEMTARKPRAELFSVMPKGDTNKPVK
jgi:nucleoid DNA-binding protein